MDRVELWSFQDKESLYQEIVIIEGGVARIPENTLAMLLRETGYVKVKEMIYE